MASDVTGDHLLPDPDDVEDRAEYELEWMTTIAGYSVVVAACRQLGIDSDDVPEPDPEVTDPRRAFDDALDDWARRQPGPHGRQVIQYKDELFSAMFVGQSGT